MNRKNRDYDLLDAREELMLVGLLKEAAFGEAKIEDIRQSLCELEEFEPYPVFKMLQQGSTLSSLNERDLMYFLQKQTFKTTLISAQDVRFIFEQCEHASSMKGSDDIPQLRYEGFLKLILPREDASLRSDVINRGFGSSKNSSAKISPDVGYLLIQLLENEAALKSEITMRLKKLHEHEWLAQSKNLVKRCFVFLQSQAAVPGVGHLSVLGVSRLLGPDFKNILDAVDVERIFQRVLFQAQSDASLLITFKEWEKFFFTKEVAVHLNELYLNHLTTMCPGCGASCQRDGGACNNITCAVCRTTFVCKTDVVDIVSSDDEEEFPQQAKGSNTTLASLSRTLSGSGRNSPESQMQRGGFSPKPIRSNNSVNSVAHGLSLNLASPTARSASSPKNNNSMNVSSLSALSVSRNNNSRLESQASLARSPTQQGNGFKKTLVFSQPGASPRVGYTPSGRFSPSCKFGQRQTDTSFVSTASTRLPDDSNLGSPIARCRSGNSSEQGDMTNLYYPSIDINNSPKLSQYSMQQARIERQKRALSLVSQSMLELLEVDSALEKEKTQLWQAGVNIEAAFDSLDRFSKGYLSDTDLWQSLQLEVNFSATYAQICTLFKDMKTPGLQNNDTTSSTALACQNPNKLSLAEFTKLIFPQESEEFQNITVDMNNDETKNVLYVVRATVSCPGCGMRTQRTHEGCPSICCPMCRTSYRCNLIGEDRDQTFRLTLPQKRKLRQFLCKAIQSAVKAEGIRKRLLFAAGGCQSSKSGTVEGEAHAHDSLNSVLLDSYLGIAGDKSFVCFDDVKKTLLSQSMDGGFGKRMFAGLSLRQIELAWYRMGKGKNELGFVDFAQSLRPFGSL